MTRPIYETEEDRAREAAAAAEIASACGWTVEKTDHLCCVDYRISMAGVHFGFLEVKARTMPSTKFPTAYLARQKWEEATALVEDGVGLAVAYACYDGIFIYFHRPAANPKTIVGGRTTAPRDAGDVEPLVLLPFSEMIKVSDLNVHAEGGDQ